MYGRVMKVVCEKCGGSGTSTDGRRDCPMCRGTGKITIKSK